MDGLGPLRPTIRSILGLKPLLKYIDSRHQRDPVSFPITPTTIHLPSIRSAWKRLSIRRRVRFTRIISGWLPTAARISIASVNAPPKDCQLCLRAQPPTSVLPIPAEDISHVLTSCPSLHPKRKEGITSILEYLLGILNKNLINPNMEIRRNQLLLVVQAYWTRLYESRAGVPLISTSQWINTPLTNHLTNRFTVTHILSLLFIGYLNFAWDLWLYRNHLLHLPTPTNLSATHDITSTSLSTPQQPPTLQHSLPDPFENPDYTDHRQI